MSISQIKPIEALQNTGRKTGKWILAGVAALVALGVVLAIVLMMGIFSVLFPEEEAVPEGGYSNIVLSEIGKNEIPAEYIPIYKAAAEKYDVPWTLIASIHRIETKFSTIKTMISPVGAAGPYQFMPCTFVGWGHPSCSGVGKGNISDSERSDPAVIKKYGGYGVDGNRDGKADMWNLEDAAFSAANYLSASGASSGEFEKAIFAYNRAGWYVDEVMEYMNLYASGGAIEVDIMPGGSGGGPEAAEKAIAAGMQLVGKSPYNWGGGRSKADISRKSFDCSSFVHWMFTHGGLTLGNYQSVVTDSLVKMGKPVKANEMKRGDLVFFDTYKINGHVGIYLGDGKFLNDNSSKGVSVDKMDNRYWKSTFKGVVRRVAG
ncbi:C40 family peptidase [Peribacillus frigoritolerans]|uniref:C40 family peptidase n=1 Tax=Peribacillus frigoritolerans TaxID=450367 RepID=UPI0028834EE2|nr:bifunctional lytic transglycosylase/C40 family peptidase [Peribacillus frigoritolerans]